MHEVDCDEELVAAGAIAAQAGADDDPAVRDQAGVPAGAVLAGESDVGAAPAGPKGSASGPAPVTEMLKTGNKDETDTPADG